MNATNSIRLSGGTAPSNGRVEVLYNGVWGTVCNLSGWTANESRAVCNILGYNSGYVRSSDLSFSGLSALYPIWISGLRCSNTTVKNITQCSYNKLIGYKEYCTHSYDALLDCDSSYYSSYDDLSGYGAIAVVGVAVPAAGVRFAGPLAKGCSAVARIFVACFRCIQCALVNLRLVLCCCFLTSWWTSRRSTRPEVPDEIVVTTTTTTPAVEIVNVVSAVTEQEPQPSFKDSELKQAPPPEYNAASKCSDAPPELPPPEYDAPPPQYSEEFPVYLGREVDPPAEAARL